MKLVTEYQNTREERREQLEKSSVSSSLMMKWIQYNDSWLSNMIIISCMLMNII